MVLTTWRRHIELECTVLLALRLVPSIEDDLALQGRLVAVALHGLFSEISVFGGRVAGCSDSSSSIERQFLGVKFFVSTCMCRFGSSSFSPEMPPFIEEWLLSVTRC